jgi:hypothetical protein
MSDTYPKGMPDDGILTYSNLLGEPGHPSPFSSFMLGLRCGMQRHWSALTMVVIAGVPWYDPNEEMDRGIIDRAIEGTR